MAPDIRYWYGAKAEANFALKRYDQAIESARQAIAINPDYNPFAHAMLVASLALTDHDTEAREALERFLALSSTGSYKTIAGWKDHFVSERHIEPRLVDRDERTLAGLRKAGMPEE
jgi:tetratricopeptide (TPR) repeat protein